MRWSQTLIRTWKQPPGTPRAVSHRLMARAGLIQEYREGLFQFWPLGYRCLQKLENLFRQELEAAGYARMLWPGRVSSVEMAAVCVGINIRNSQVRLPARVYQLLQDSYGEPKPRAGLLDACESVVCQAFQYKVEVPEAGGTPDGAEELRLAFERILRRCGVPWVTAEDDISVGRGGPTSAYVRAMLLDSGQDLILRSDRGNYAATEDYAASGPRPWTFGGDPASELEKVHTPGLSVRDVAKALDVQPADILKTIVFKTDAKGPPLASGVNPKWAVAVVRGDHAVNRRKLGGALFENFQVGLGPESGEEGEKELRAEWPIGFVGPDAAARKPDAVLLVDYDAAANCSWVAGANEQDFHLRNFNWFRECGDRLADPRKTAVADLRDAQAGDPSPVGDGGRLVALRCVELGRFIEAQPPPSTVPPHPDLAHGRVVTRAYEIDLFRLLGCAVERSHDEYGIIWPAALAPFSAVVTALATEGETAAVAERLYTQLNAAGIDAILDDRDVRPGVKFTDADLIGFPVRVTVGERGLREGKVEVKARRSSEPRMVPADSAVDAVRAALEG